MLRPFLKKKLYLYFVSLTTVVLILLISYFSTLYIEKNIKTEILETSTNDVFEITTNTLYDIEKIILDDIESFIIFTKDGTINKLDEKNLFNILDKRIKTLITKNIKYAYLLYVDEKGVFRFIADASDDEDKVKPYEKYDIDSPKWIETYESKKPTIIKHDFSNELSITYLRPLVVNDVTIMLVIDFSTNKVEEISSNISHIKTFLLSFWVFIMLLLVVLIYQTFKTYKVRKDSYIDRLTGIYSRNYLQDYEMFLDLSKYIICAIDVDYFKKVNDTYGHLVGDDILVQITNTIKNEIRKNKDVLIRYGGEEFCLLIYKSENSNDNSLNLLNRIHEKFKNKKFKISKTEDIKITLSIGVNTQPQNQRDFISAFKLADIALYNAKNRGRNAIEIYQDRNDEDQFLTINDIKDSILAKTVVCYYQEIIHEEENSNIKHYEALVRIIKDGQIYSPEKFLPTIKSTHITTKLTKELLSIIYKKLKNSSDNVFISLNFTPQDLQNDSIISILKTYAQEPNIANRMALEIVETEEILSYEDITATLLELKKLGYKIYIDDFGSGYSNFIYLTKIQADAIKIDGSIINTINSDELSYLVAKNIVNFAKEANIEVIAEYVSTKEIYDTVKSLGITKFQGFYFSEPA